jgi:hypothetical protein
MAKDSGGEEEVGNVNGKVVDMVGSGLKKVHPVNHDLLLAGFNNISSS